MKVVILAGGFGTRISEESVYRPKPMIEIGERPILWHIMKYFSSFGFNEFIICCGYKGFMIKEYFINYRYHIDDITVDLADKKIELISKSSEDWKITLVDTGENSTTGGRLKRVSHLIDDTFFMTYGDGLSDVNLNNLLDFHKKHSKIATVTAVQPPGRFGSLNIKKDVVFSFEEKPVGDGGWINGGYFVLESKALDYINGNDVWEQTPLEQLSADKQLSAYKHFGFWQAMDTLRDKLSLENLLVQNKAPWVIW